MTQSHSFSSRAFGNLFWRNLNSFLAFFWHFWHFHRDKERKIVCQINEEMWIISNSVYNRVKEIQKKTRSQFHQHFICTFFVQKWFEQLFSSYVWLYNFMAQKAHVKCWSNWHMELISSMIYAHLFLYESLFASYFLALDEL